MRGLHWRVGKRGLTRHLSQASHDHHTAKHHFKKALNNNFKSCADRKKTHTSASAGKKTVARTKQRTVGTKSQVYLGKFHNMSTQQRQAPKPLWFEISVLHFQSSRVRCSFVCVVITIPVIILCYPFVPFVRLPTLVFFEVSFSRRA